MRRQCTARVLRGGNLLRRQCSLAMAIRPQFKQRSIESDRGKRQARNIGHTACTRRNRAPFFSASKFQLRVSKRAQLGLSRYIQAKNDAATTPASHPSSIKKKQQATRKLHLPAAALILQNNVEGMNDTGEVTCQASQLAKGRNYLLLRHEGSSGGSAGVQVACMPCQG